MRYGNDTNLDEEKADDFLNKMIIAEKVAKGSIILGVIPVSYTHLHVYKRQR